MLEIPEAKDIVLGLPVFDEVAQGLKEKGTYEKELTAQELESIMSEVANGLVKGQAAVKASVPEMNVQIDKSVGRVNGIIDMKSPIEAIIKIDFALSNHDSQHNKLKLKDLNVKPKAKGFLGGVALKAANIPGKAREALQDPNRAFEEALIVQLDSRGARLDGVDLRFTEKALCVALRGGVKQ